MKKSFILHYTIFGVLHSFFKILPLGNISFSLENFSAPWYAILLTMNSLRFSFIETKMFFEGYFWRIQNSTFFSFTILKMYHCLLVWNFLISMQLILFLFLYTVVLIGQLSVQGTFLSMSTGKILIVTRRCCDCHLVGRGEGFCYTSFSEQGSSHSKGFSSPDVQWCWGWETMLCVKCVYINQA